MMYRFSAYEPGPEALERQKVVGAKLVEVLEGVEHPADALLSVLYCCGALASLTPGLGEDTFAYNARLAFREAERTRRALGEAGLPVPVVERCLDKPLSLHVRRQIAGEG